MANFIRSKLGKRRSRLSLATGVAGTADDDDDDPAYRDFGSSSHYSRKVVSTSRQSGSNGSPPTGNTCQKNSPKSQHSDSTTSDDNENLTVEDYTQPVDAIVPGLTLPVSIPILPPAPTPSDEDYTEPYEVKKALEEFDHKQGAFPSHSSESLNKPLSKKCHNVAQNGSIAMKKTQSPKKGKSVSQPKHSPIVEEDASDNYDKLVSPVLPGEPANVNRYGKLYTFGTPTATNQVNEVTYQAPWDKGDVERDFEMRFQASSPKSSPLHATKKKKVPTATLR